MTLAQADSWGIDIRSGPVTRGPPQVPSFRDWVCTGLKHRELSQQSNRSASGAGSAGYQRRSLNTSEPQSPHLENGDNNSTCLTRLLGGVHEILPTRSLVCSRHLKKPEFPCLLPPIPPQPQPQPDGAPREGEVRCCPSPTAEGRGEGAAPFP